MVLPFRVRGTNECTSSGLSVTNTSVHKYKMKTFSALESRLLQMVQVKFGYDLSLIHSRYKDRAVHALAKHLINRMNRKMIECS